jgi:hypothetical protein
VCPLYRQSYVRQAFFMDKGVCGLCFWSSLGIEAYLVPLVFLPHSVYVVNNRHGQGSLVGINHTHTGCWQVRVVRGR